MEIEKQRGISVASSVMQMEYRDCIINLLDTPGHQDFSEDTYRVLTAVDSALMVIDAANGVESQTLRLLEVCRARNTPIVTFINKMDREVKPPMELMDEIETALGIEVVPFTWPVGMGKSFAGVIDIPNMRMRMFKAGEDRVTEDSHAVVDVNDPALKARLGADLEHALAEVELIKEAMPAFDQEAFLAGHQSPVFFGSAINNFGIQEILNSLIDWAPAPKGRDATVREVMPDEEKFSGFVFKIQANMDPKHRDRIAFLRVCSGRFERGMKMKHLRINRDIAASSVVTFMSHDRELVEEAYAGDIIGIPNHGNIQIGDSFSEGEQLAFTGIPFFAPELFRSVRIKNPLKMKQLQKGLQQLGEEGAVQVFKPHSGADLILGAVGVLQFEVVTARLAAEYGVEAVFDSASIWSARWVSCDDKKKLAEFEKANAGNLSIDAGGNLAYLAPNRVNLGLTQERWPDIVFHETREHAVNLND